MMKKCMFALLIVFTTLSAKPQAIVFDFGGVLTKEPNREVVARFLQSTFSLSDEAYARVDQKKNRALQMGKTDEAFWFEYAQRKGVELPENWFDELKRVMIEEVNVNPAMYSFVNGLKEEGLSVALLSNIDARLANLFRDEGLYDAFDSCFLSYQIGFEKPDHRIYEYLVRTMHLPAGEIVVVDDSPANIRAAKDVGLDAILFTSQEELTIQLEMRGITLKKSEERAVDS